jgi:hypothetical protein
VNAMSRLYGKQTATHCESYRVRAIVGAEFVNEVLHVEVDCSFRDAQHVGNLLVAVAITNQAEHIQFARC